MEFSDSSTGFFGGLREQFAQLALEERLACQWEDKESVGYPSFGAHNDAFETVVRPFYAAWSGFSTQKSFAWKDAYRYSEAPDRRVRRLMEKENRRLREEGIREFNDAVRSLVAFVKKRDPRYKANAQNEAQRQETLRQSVAAQAAKSRAMNHAKMRQHVVPEWAQSEGHGANEDEESSESEVESFECVACYKHFKSQKQFEAHERSKKHLKAVKQLRREMLMENEELDLEPTIQVGAPSQEVATSQTLQASGEDEDGVDVPVPPEKQSEETVVGGSGDTQSVDSHQSHPSGSDSEDNDTKSIEDGDYASRETIETRLRSDFGSVPEDPVAPLTEQLASSSLDDQLAGSRVGKAKQKRAKKAAQSAEQPGLSVCANCHTTFASRTKLFAHIKEHPTHAQPVATTKKGRRR